ncbi:helix-turn-helix domain-containing protein [Actinomyces urogenitalis]|uniref:helix-turn-helix domain-containing protein n=1 Tax=Actinomyces urogenitalis TaxID=103621 RepID=UPI00389AD3DF
MSGNQAERERIGATLRTIRELRGYTPDELAAEMGISRPYLSNIEAGRKNLTPRLLVRACEALVVPQKSLIRDGYLPSSR